MEIENEKELHLFTKDLTKKASEISSKITNQSLILEAIHSGIEGNNDEFHKNLNSFDLAIHKLENDKRNLLIIGLIGIVIILLYVIRAY